MVNEKNSESITSQPEKFFGGGLNAFHVCEVTGREHS